MTAKIYGGKGGNRTHMAGFSDRSRDQLGYLTKESQPHETPILSERSMVPRRGLEPPRVIHPQRPQRCASAISPSRQDILLVLRVGFEPTNGGFTDRSLRPLGYLRVVGLQGIEPWSTG